MLDPAIGGPSFDDDDAMAEINSEVVLRLRGGGGGGSAPPFFDWDAVPNLSGSSRLPSESKRKLEISNEPSGTSLSSPVQRQNAHSVSQQRLWITILQHPSRRLLSEKSRRCPRRNSRRAVPKPSTTPRATLKKVSTPVTSLSPSLPRSLSLLPCSTESSR